MIAIRDSIAWGTYLAVKKDQQDSMIRHLSNLRPRSWSTRPILNRWNVNHSSCGEKIMHHHQGTSISRETCVDKVIVNTAIISNPNSILSFIKAPFFDPKMSLFLSSIWQLSNFLIPLLHPFHAVWSSSNAVNVAINSFISTSNPVSEPVEIPRKNSCRKERKYCMNLCQTSDLLLSLSNKNVSRSRDFASSRGWNKHQGARGLCRSRASYWRLLLATTS